MTDDFVQHWMNSQNGPSTMRSASHTCIIHGVNAMRAGNTDKAERYFEIASELLVMANDSAAGAFDE